MAELKPCPFCGGKAKISYREYKYGGQNYRGDKKIKYRVQVICNTCHSRGKPVITDWMINPNPWFSYWHDAAQMRHREEFGVYDDRAASAWNRRSNDG